jgi:hypothetical protein
MAQNTEAEGIDERIPFIGFVEIDFAGDRWDAEAIAVVGDAGDDASKEAAVISEG